MGVMNLRLLLVPILALSLMGFAKKQPKVTVRFHTQANKEDTEQFSMSIPLQNPPRQVFFQKIPFLSENDVAAIYPFPASDGTMGCAFKFDGHGTLELDTQSIMRRGSEVVGFINGRLVSDMLVDRRVSDGVLVVPNGLTPLEIAALQLRFHTMGDPKGKK